MVILLDNWHGWNITGKVLRAVFVLYCCAKINTKHMVAKVMCLLDVTSPDVNVNRNEGKAGNTHNYKVICAFNFPIFQDKHTLYT